jgi:hypothetical protein
MLRRLLEKLLLGHEPTNEELIAAGIKQEYIDAAKGAGVPILVIVELLIEYGPTAIAVLKKIFPKWFGGIKE